MQEVALHVRELVPVQQVHRANVHDDVLVDGRQQLVDVPRGVSDRLAGDAETAALVASPVARQTRVQVSQRQGKQKIVANQLVLVQVGRPMIDDVQRRRRRPGARAAYALPPVRACASGVAVAAVAGTAAAGDTVVAGAAAAAAAAAGRTVQ